jgi:hypothetical protein
MALRYRVGKKQRLAAAAGSCGEGGRESEGARESEGGRGRGEPDWVDNGGVRGGERETQK